MTLIKRDDAIEAIKKEIQDFEANYMHDEDDEEYGHDIGFVAGLHRAKTFIRSLPSAEAVEVVRCKDCRHKYVSGNGTTQYYVCDFMDAQYEEDGFCHHGESEVEE